MHVLFLTPHYPTNQRQFVRALHSLGVQVTGISDVPWDTFDPELRGWLHGYERIERLTDAQCILDGVRRVQAREYVDRLESTVEMLMLQTAQVREACGIPGLAADKVLLCRDKYEMKRYLLERGIPCAQVGEVHRPEDAHAFVARCGYPVIVKPRDSAGTSGTVRCDDDAGLNEALGAAGIGSGGPSVAIEEFVKAGHEGFYDTLTVDGQPVFEAISHYYPVVLEGMRHLEMNPYIITTNRLDAGAYPELKAFGQKVIQTLGLTTCPTHMEWFMTDQGLSFSEIAARPPGVWFWDLYCYANDMDLYRHWAEAVVYGRTEPRPSRNYSAGIISLRPNRYGRIVGYSGVDEVMHSAREHLIDWHLPALGSATADVGAGYMGHAWVRARHPDYDGLRGLLEWIGRTLKVWAE